MKRVFLAMAALALISASAGAAGDDGEVYLEFVLHVTQGGGEGIDLMSVGAATTPDRDFLANGRISVISGETDATDSLIEIEGSREEGTSAADFSAEVRFDVLFNEGAGSTIQVSGEFNSQASVAPGEEALLDSFSVMDPNSGQSTNIEVYCRAR